MKWPVMRKYLIASPSKTYYVCGTNFTNTGKELGLTTVSLTGHTVNGLERRIRNIMKKTEKTKRISFAVLVMSMVLMCPLTVFAASWGMSNLQDLVVKKLLDYGS